MQKKSVLYEIIPFELGQERHRKTTKITFFAFRFFTEIIIAKPKVNIHSKIQSLF